VKTLPKFLDLKPLRIDYTTKRKPQKGSIKDGEGANARIWALGEVNPKFEAQEGFSKRAPIQTTLGEHWHAFYDLRGVKYFFNFQSGESMRRPHDRFINIDVEQGQQITKEAAWSTDYKEVVRQMAVSKEGRRLGSFGQGQMKDTGPPGGP